MFPVRPHRHAWVTRRGLGGTRSSPSTTTPPSCSRCIRCPPKTVVSVRSSVYPFAPPFRILKFPLSAACGTGCPVKRNVTLPAVYKSSISTNPLQKKKRTRPAREVPSRPFERQTMYSYSPTCRRADRTLSLLTPQPPKIRGKVGLFQTWSSGRNERVLYNEVRAFYSLLFLPSDLTFYRFSSGCYFLGAARNVEAAVTPLCILSTAGFAR